MSCSFGWGSSVAAAVWFTKFTMFSALGGKVVQEHYNVVRYFVHLCAGCFKQQAAKFVDGSFEVRCCPWLALLLLGRSMHCMRFVLSGSGGVFCCCGCSRLPSCSALAFGQGATTGHTRPTRHSAPPTPHRRHHRGTNRPAAPQTAPRPPRPQGSSTSQQPTPAPPRAGCLLLGAVAVGAVSLREAVWGWSWAVG